MTALAIPLEMVRRFSREDFYWMRDQGLLTRHTELLEGVLVEKMTISPRHRHILHKLRSSLESMRIPGHVVMQESPISLGNSEPEPDISIIAGSIEDFKDVHPTTAEWVIEVSISSLSLDISKRKIYAEAGIPHYWIVDPEEGKILVFQEPHAEGYNKETVYSKNDEITFPLLAGKSIRLDWI